MELNIEKNTVTIYSKNYKLDQIAAKLAQLNGSQVYSFFTNRGIFVPRKLNCYALISILNNKLKLLNSNSLSKDYFTRLQYYKSFSELQLFNLYKEIATFDDFKNYRISLFKLVLYNYVGLNLTDGELQYLINLKKLPMESFEEYFDQVSCACFEQENTFDGQDIEVLKETLEFSAANTEITGLGDKYGIPIPQRLKKTDILEYLYWYLGKQNKLTRELKQALDVMTITDISNYIKAENVGISANLTKSELVTYLFFTLSQYDIPTTTMKRVEILEEYEPLEFKVDLNAVSNFKADEPKKVIHFKHDSGDEEFYEALSDLYHTTMQQAEVQQEEETVKTLTLEHEAIIPTVQKKMSIADIKARQMGVAPKFQGVEDEDDDEDEYIPPLEDAPSLGNQNSAEEEEILKQAGLDTMDEDIQRAQEEARIAAEKAKAEAEAKAKKEAAERAKTKAQREAEAKALEEARLKAEAEKKARDAQILAQAQEYVKQYEARMKKMQEAKAAQAQQQAQPKAITQKKIVKTITKPNGEKVTVEFTPEQFAALKAKRAAEQSGKPIDIASIVKAQAAQQAKEEETKRKALAKAENEQKANASEIKEEPVAINEAPNQPTQEPIAEVAQEVSAPEPAMEFEVVQNDAAEVTFETIEEELGDSFSWDMIEDIGESDDDSFGWTVEEVETVIYVDEDGNEIEGYDESMAGDDVILVEETVESAMPRTPIRASQPQKQYVDDEDDSDFFEPAFNTPAYYEDGANAIRSNLVKSSKSQPVNDTPVSSGLDDERSFLSLNVVVANTNYMDKKLDKKRKKK